MATDSLFMNAPDHVDVPTGHVIYAEGDPGDHMYGIVEGEVVLSKGLAVIAVLGANKAGDEYVAQDRLLVALAASDTPAGKALKAAGVTAQGLDKAVADIRKGRKVDSPNAESNIDALNKYARDVTAVASCDTTLAEIDRGLFLFLVHESPTFALGIMGALAGRLRASDEMVARLAPQASDRT